MMETELYRAIRNDAPPTQLEIDGRRYTSHHIHAVLDPEPKTLKVTTLTGIVEYLTKNVDGLDIKALIAQVEDFDHVVVWSRLSQGFAQRHAYISASFHAPAIPFGQFLPVEALIIKLQANFEDSGDRAAVLSYIGNVKEDNIRNTKDDGISQEMTVKTGILAVEDIVLPNPVKLQPFRTFNEVAQPPSEFIFRAQKGPAFALFEADNSAWKAEAMANIKEYLEQNVPNLQVIA